MQLNNTEKIKWFNKNVSNSPIFKGTIFLGLILLSLLLIADSFYIISYMIDGVKSIIASINK